MDEQKSKKIKQTNKNEKERNEYINMDIRYIVNE